MMQLLKPSLFSYLSKHLTGSPIQSWMGSFVLPVIVLSMWDKQKDIPHLGKAM